MNGTNGRDDFKDAVHSVDGKHRNIIIESELGNEPAWFWFCRIGAYLGYGAAFLIYPIGLFAICVYGGIIAYRFTGLYWIAVVTVPVVAAILGLLISLVERKIK